jgi:hypothetical protein
VNSFETLDAGPVTASVVVSASGQAISAAGNSKGLGNKTDLELLKWFRRRSQVILTSGLTAELENYRMPQSAQLAILSKTERSYPGLADNLKDVMLLKGVDSYQAAITRLADLGYQRIHTEFGPTGFCALVNAQSVEGFISSVSPGGIEAFVRDNQLSAMEPHFIEDELFVARAIGRGNK